MLIIYISIIVLSTLIYLYLSRFLKRYIIKWKPIIKLFKLDKDKELHQTARRAKRMIASEIICSPLWLVITYFICKSGEKINVLNGLVSTWLIELSGFMIFGFFIALGGTIISYLHYKDKEPTE